MGKIFLDSDVILDFLLDRAPFSEAIEDLLEYVMANNIRPCVSPITITNLNYIIGRLENDKTAARLRREILQLVSIEAVDEEIVHNASDSEFKDFEDAVQNYCAEAANHQIIITRNVKDYRESNLSIMTPQENLAKVKSES